MFHRSVARAALAVSVLVLAGCSQTDPWEKRARAAEAAAEAPMHQPSPEELFALAQPGDEHSVLQPLVGRFAAEVTSYTPDGTMTSAGVLQSDWTLGNRFIRSTFQSEMPEGMPPFEGEGLLGFDNVTKLYQGIWVDTMGTTIMPVSEGVFDASTRTLTMQREVHLPQIGMVGTLVDTTVIESRDAHRFSLSLITPDGAAIPMVDIAYTRM